MPTTAFRRRRRLGLVAIRVTPVKKYPRFYKTMKSLAAITAAVTVPVHGHVVNFTRRNATPMRTQAWEFFKQIARGCAWAAAIAVGMLVYTEFVKRWRESGFPTIPIAALAAMDQVVRGPSAGPGNVIPLGGGGNAQSQGPSRTTERPRQTSLLDLEDYEG